MESELAKLNVKLLAAGRAGKCANEYAALKSDEERFSYTLALLEDFEVIPKLRPEEKSSAVSASHRKAGNELFVSPDSRRRRDEVLELYTKSVAYAETNSRELAYAYGNRSALLFEAALYEHCLRDVDRALALDYPDHLRPKLLNRRVNCLTAVEETPREKIPDEATNCKEKKKSQTSTDVRTKRFPARRKLFDEDKFAPSTPEDNPELPGISSALEVAYGPRFGRYVRATRKILPGEVLGVQKGYATILDPENSYTHCSNCLRQTWSSVPCDKCARALYCDENCRTAAWHDHHEFECGVVGVLLEYEMSSLGLMSMRLAIRAVKDAGGFAPLKERLEAQQSWRDPRTAGFTGTPPILNENDYLSVYNLARNTEDRSVPDLFGRSCNAAYIVYCLGKLSDFFGEKFSSDVGSVRKNPWSCFVGGLIMRHQQIIPTNGHTVTETKGLFARQRGTAILPFLSLLNHSCDSSVTRVHYGTRIAVYALQTIEAGQQVYDNYGMHYSIEHLGLRRQKLKRQFHFECQCRPCMENWPLFHAIPSWTEKGLGPQQSLQLKKALKNFNRYVDLATADDVEDKLNIVKDLEHMLKVLHALVDLPCREVNEVAETLKRMYDLLSIRYQSLCDKV